MKSRLFVSTLIFLAAPLVAAAQSTTIGTPMTTYNQGIAGVDPFATMIQDIQMFDQIGLRSMGMTGPGSGRASSSPAGRAAALSMTQYRDTGVYLVPKLLEKSGDREAVELAKSLLDDYRRAARQDQCLPNDIAYALRHFVMYNYLAYHDLRDVATGSDASDVRNSSDPLMVLSQQYGRSARMHGVLAQGSTIHEQFNLLLRSKPGIQRVPNEEKQKFVELLALKTGVMWAAYRSAGSGAPETLAKARSMAKRNLELLYGNADRITIGDSGLDVRP